MDLIHIISLAVIALVLYSLFGKHKYFTLEGFAKKKSSKKSSKKSDGKKSSKKGGKKGKKGDAAPSDADSDAATSDVDADSDAAPSDADSSDAAPSDAGSSDAVPVDANTTYKLTDPATINTINSTQSLVSQTQTQINNLNGSYKTIKNLITSLQRKDEFTNFQILIATQKKNFAKYLIRKTQNEIDYLNGLVSLANSIGYGSATAKKQNAILYSKVNQQLYCVNSYLLYANSYIASTYNLFGQLNQSIANFNGLFSDVQNQITQYSSTASAVTSNITSTNSQIVTTNSLITKYGIPDATPFELFAEEHYKIIDQLSSTGIKSSITMPSNLASKSLSNIPTLGSNELVVPSFTQPNLSIFASGSSAPTPAPAPGSVAFLDNYTANQQLTPYLPVKQTISIPTSLAVTASTPLSSVQDTASPQDVNYENEFVYMLASLN
jgi:hypothetical protein